MPDESGTTVLIVDDERLVADTLALILKRKGWRPITAYSAVEALRRLRESQPVAAILDVMLPDMNGIKLAEQIRQRFPDCQVLLLSGRPEATELLEAAEARGRHFEILVKPVDPGELLARLPKMPAVLPAQGR